MRVIYWKMTRIWIRLPNFMLAACGNQTSNLEWYKLTDKSKGHSEARFFRGRGGCEFRKHPRLAGRWSGHGGRNADGRSLHIPLHILYGAPSMKTSFGVKLFFEQWQISIRSCKKLIGENSIDQRLKYWQKSQKCISSGKQLRSGSSWWCVGRSTVYLLDAVDRVPRLNRSKPPASRAYP